MKTVGCKELSFGPGMRGDVDEAYLVRAGDMPGCCIELVYLPGDGSPVLSGCKRGNAPVGNREYEDMFRAAGREMYGLSEKGLQLGGIFFGRATSVLIIYPDEQGYKIIGGEEKGAGDGIIQLVRCPACAGDDLGGREGMALLAEEPDGLVGICFCKKDSFTDGVGVP